MIKVEIYNNGRILDMSSHEIKKNKKEVYFLDKDVVDFIKELEKTKIANVILNDKDINFNTKDYKITIKEYHTLKNYPLFEVLKVRLNRIYRQEKLKKAKLNKLKIGAVAVLTSAGIASTFLLEQDAKGVSFDVIENTSNLIVSSLEEDDFFETKQFTIEEVEPEIIRKEIDEEEKEELKKIKDEDDYKTYEYDINIPYYDRTDSEKFANCKKLYGDLITKYANEYGLDPNLMIAVATQESGVHDSDYSDVAVGLMRIEKSVWEGNEITVYNYETKSDETFKITKKDLQDLETNIKIGCMIMRQQMDYMRNNAIAALQCYNMGYGNMDIILDSYAKDIGSTKIEVLDNLNDYGYITDPYYRSLISVGDQNYVENVLSYLDSDSLSVNITDEEVLILNLNKTKTSVKS